LLRIVALIDPDNAASLGVARKTGLHYEKDTVRPGEKTMRLYAMDRGMGNP